jgi:hypothetical protein
MSNPGVESLHIAVQQALAAGDFDTARQLSVQLGQTIIVEASAAAPAARAAYVQQGLSRLEEHLSLARVLRAHIATQLRANAGACLYNEASNRGNSWRFDA